MKEIDVIIERVRRINKDYQHLELGIDDTLSQIKPGQSLLAWHSKDWHPYLREHWWPVSLLDKRLVIERPADQVYNVGQVVSVIGPIGMHYRFRNTLRNVLLIAYETPPTPLLMTIPWLLQNRVSVTMVLLGKAAEYNTAHLPAEVEIVHGDGEFNWPDRVMTLGWADQVFVAVRPDDEHHRFGEIWRLFHELRADVPKNYLFGVFQPTLPCGVGGCHACMVRMKQGMKQVCIDGPAYDLTTVWLPS